MSEHHPRPRRPRVFLQIEALIVSGLFALNAWSLLEIVRIGKTLSALEATVASMRESNQNKKP